MRRRPTSRKLYGFYDHKHNLAKVGIALDPMQRFSLHAIRTYRLELVFAIEVPEYWIRSAEFVAHLAFEGRRLTHPVSGMPGSTEWFDVSRDALVFLEQTLERFVAAASASPNPHKHLEAARVGMQRTISALQRQRRGEA